MSESDLAWSERVRQWAHNLDAHEQPHAAYDRATCISALNDAFSRHDLRLVEGGDAARHHPPLAVLPVGRLTELERRYLEGLANDAREAYAEEVAKLLRIHDRQAARIEELERQIKYTPHPGGIRQPVVTTTGDFGEALRERLKDR